MLVQQFWGELVSCDPFRYLLLNTSKFMKSATETIDIQWPILKGPISLLVYKTPCKFTESVTETGEKQSRCKCKVQQF